MSSDIVPDETSWKSPHAGRIVVRESLYHQVENQQPASIGEAWSRKTIIADQPYERRTKVGEQWKPLERGWIEEAGQLWIRNDGSSILELCFFVSEDQALRDMHSPPRMTPEAHWLIPPGETFRGMPKDVRMLYIRSQSGECKFTVVLFPV